MTSTKASPRAGSSPSSRSARATRACGLCGTRGKLAKTECCGNWICDDEQSYVLFSYARNSCSRNHRRYTLCGYHSAEGHAGSWQECTACRNGFETELFVYYGTNEYNFVTLEDPPSFTPTLCASCKRRINLGQDGHTVLPTGDHLCEACASSPPPRTRRRA
jgi:hypothetical protein